MGVDFFECHYCQRTICDSGEYLRCDGEDCYCRWCDDSCADREGWQCDENGNESCAFCRNEEFEDCDLVDFLLERLGWTRQEAIVELNKEIEAKEACDGNDEESEGEV